MATYSEWEQRQLDIRSGEELDRIYDRMYNNMRYAYVKCATCGKTWQRIDFKCAAHTYSCDNPVIKE
jgi:hypothetical protein